MSETSLRCTVENLRLTWGRGRGARSVLHDTSVGLPLSAAGWKVAIVGQSGGGKTTLLLTLAGLKRPSEGRVTWYIDDQPACWWERKKTGPSRARLRDLRARDFGFAFQDALLVPSLTVQANLVMVQQRVGRDRRVARDRAEAELSRLFPDFGAERLKVFMGKFSGELSGGERLRVSVAQALVHDPRVVFADEPTGALDDRNRHRILERLEQWLDAKGEPARGLVWVTHNIAAANVRPPDALPLRVDEVLHVQDSGVHRATTRQAPT